ncbi:MAG: ASKHA domain-containing protein [Clostridia bacterium]
MAKVIINKNGKQSFVTAETGKLISDVLDFAEHKIDYPCARKGICKKCTVKIVGDLSEISETEKDVFGEDKNLRLACITKIMGDCEIFLENENDIQVGSLKEAITNYNPYHKNYGIAVDIGTTTLAVSLYKNDERIGSLSSKNPQISFGADVISRIEQQMAGKTSELSKAIRGGINEIINELSIQLNVEKNLIDKAVITGNTTMLHLLTENDCKPLSCAPFDAKYLGGEKVLASEIGIDINENAEVFLPNCFSAFVGADITTAILASGMCDKNETSLLIDIGTNGEMALVKDGKLSCCSTAAGPAFEGLGITCGMHGTSGAIDHVSFENGDFAFTTIGNTKAKGICGSGVIDSIAAMLDSEVLDETGMIDDMNEEFEERIVDNDDIVFLISGDVGIYGKDVRAIQLAKSAIGAGAKTLVHENKITSDGVDRVYIAGGFGSFINIENAGKIGLIPNEFVPKVKVLGNAALLGAEMLLLNKDLHKFVKTLTEEFSSVDLATSAFFMDAYVENMCFD